MTGVGMRFLRVAVTVCALGVEISAQQPPFSTGVSLVSVPVTVTGRDGQMPAVALTSADFRVFENGDRQAVTLVSRDRRPVSLCLVLDSSGSMQGDLKRELAVRIGREIIAGLAPVDEVAIVLFSQQPEVVLPWTRVTDVPAINWARWQPHGWTSIVDAMHAALAQAESARNPRSIIALITDGFDTSSRSALSSVVKTRRQSETTVYAYWTGVAAPGACPMRACNREADRPPSSRRRRWDSTWICSGPWWVTLAAPCTACRISRGRQPPCG